MTDSSSPCIVNKYYLRHILYYKISSNSKNNYTKLPSILQYKLLAALCTLTTPGDVSNGSSSKSRQFVNVPTGNPTSCSWCKFLVSTQYHNVNLTLVIKVNAI